VSAAAGLSASSGTKFIGGAFAESSHDDNGFSPQGILNAGILSSHPGSLIQTYVDSYLLVIDDFDPVWAGYLNIIIAVVSVGDLAVYCRI
jgi:hypothetical protein